MCIGFAQRRWVIQLLFYIWSAMRGCNFKFDRVIRISSSAADLWTFIDELAFLDYCNKLSRFLAFLLYH